MNPISVTADSLGNVFVGDASTVSSRRSRRPALPRCSPLRSPPPQSLATDSFNNLYVLDSGAKTVIEIATNGLATRIIATGLSAPKSLALDSSGNLFVGDTGVIYRFDAQTFARTTASSAAPSPRRHRRRRRR